MYNTFVAQEGFVNISADGQGFYQQYLYNHGKVSAQNREW
jgi:hypothetical protein